MHGGTITPREKNGRFTFLDRRSEQEVLERTISGWPQREIRRELGYCEKTIRRVLRKYDCIPQENPARTLREFEKEWMVYAFEHLNMDFGMIAFLSGRDRHTVRILIRREFPDCGDGRIQDFFLFRKLQMYANGDAISDISERFDSRARALREELSKNGINFAVRRSTSLRRRKEAFRVAIAHAAGTDQAAEIVNIKHRTALRWIRDGRRLAILEPRHKEEARRFAQEFGSS